MRETSGALVFIKSGPLGPFANNSYVLADRATGDAIVIDAPAGIEDFLSRIEGFNVRQIVITHRHADHWGGIEALVAKTGAPVVCHAADAEPYAQHVAATLAHGDVVSAGSIAAGVIHTPGHTLGSICLLVGEHLITGDTLFPGGPGRTARPEALRQEIDSIVRSLYTLPEALLVHPGHGADTTIGASRAEYALFAARSHPDDLCGDVTWAAS